MYLKFRERRGGSKLRQQARWLPLTLIGAIVMILVGSATDVMVSAVSAQSPDILYTKLWTHLGPNYSEDLYFPDSGTPTGADIREQIVTGKGIPLPSEYRSSCGPNFVRDGECMVEHVSGGGHCESLGWARPDRSDCGCVVHVGANAAEWNQVCRVTVRRREVSASCAADESQCLKPIQRTLIPGLPATPIEGLKFQTLWEWLKPLNRATFSYRIALDRASYNGANSVATLQTGDSSRYPKDFREDMRRLLGWGEQIVQLSSSRTHGFDVGPVTEAYYRLMVDMAWFIEPHLRYTTRRGLNCGRNGSVLNTLTEYLIGIASNDKAKAIAALQGTSRLLHCISADASLQLNASLARLLEFRENPPEILRELRGGILPILILVLDATKHAGATPLQKHVIRYFDDYAQSWKVSSSGTARLGLWIPDSLSPELLHASTFCEVTNNEVCISGLGVLRGLTDPLAIGLGDCSLKEMIEGGLSPSGAYSCRAGSCIAAAAKLARLSTDGFPPGIVAAAELGRTPLGISLAGAMRTRRQRKPRVRRYPQRVSIRTTIGPVHDWEGLGCSFVF
jgi:hypothetical protein